MSNAASINSELEELIADLPGKRRAEMKAALAKLRPNPVPPRKDPAQIRDYFGVWSPEEADKIEAAINQSFEKVALSLQHHLPLGAQDAHFRYVQGLNIVSAS